MRWLIILSLFSSCVSVDTRRKEYMRKKDSVLTEYIKKNEQLRRTESIN